MRLMHSDKLRLMEGHRRDKHAVVGTTMNRTHDVAARIAIQCAELSKSAEEVGLKFLTMLLEMAVVEARRQQYPSVVLPIADGKDPE